MFCRLRLIAAVTCFVTCALFVVLWMRSYRWSDAANICYASGQTVVAQGQSIPGNHFISTNTALGNVSFYYEPAYHLPIGAFPARPVRTGIDVHSSNVADEWWWKKANTFGFAYKSRPQGAMTIAIPFWFLTLLTAAAGTLLWMQRPYRFTLRGALVATTFIAVVLGTGVALSR
jgi:hypothetical protein